MPGRLSIFVSDPHACSLYIAMKKRRLKVLAREPWNLLEKLDKTALILAH
jgi:hypothetical protein